MSLPGDSRGLLGSNRGEEIEKKAAKTLTQNIYTSFVFVCVCVICNMVCNNVLMILLSTDKASKMNGLSL